MPLLLWLLVMVPLVQTEVTPEEFEDTTMKIGMLLFQIGEISNPALGIVRMGIEMLQSDPTEEIMSKLTDILDKVVEISNKVKKFEAHTEQQLDGLLEAVVDRVTAQEERDSALHELKSVITNINHLWLRYTALINNPKLNNATLQNFITIAIGMEHKSLNDWLRQLDDLINGDSLTIMSPTVLTAIHKYNTANALKTCGLGRSDKQQFMDIYRLVAMLESRAAYMMAYAFTQQIIMDGENYSAEIELLTNHARERLRKYIHTTKAVMKSASNTIRSCDPKAGFIKGESCAEMVRAFQTFLIDEENWGACSGSCEGRSGKQYEGFFAQFCGGHLSHCKNAGESVTVCPTNDSDSRQFEWFQEGDGSDTKCPREVITREEHFQFQTFTYCEMCVCTCQSVLHVGQPRPIISLLDTVTDIYKRMVVTGVKIHYHSNIIQLQVQQGKIDKSGNILEDSVRWVPLKNITHSPNRWLTDFVRDGETLVEEAHYIMVGRKREKIILDTVLVPKRHVVGGVRFRSQKAAGAVRSTIIQVLSVPFDIETGKLSKERAEWIGPNDSEPRQPITFDNPDIPVKYKLNTPRQESNLYVEFQPTGEIDYGQTTIPFWDLQEVFTSPAVPLQGVGLFHKGHAFGKFGGFIALKLYPLDDYHFPDFENKPANSGTVGGNSSVVAGDKIRISPKSHKHKVRRSAHASHKRKKSKLI